MIQAPRRAFNLVIQDRDIRGLDIEFQVERSLKPEQNKATVIVYGLAAENRRRLSQITGGVIVELRAGYDGRDPLRPTTGDPAGAGGEPDLPVIFLGKLREVTSLRNGPEWETHVTSGDGDGKDKPIAFTLGPGATLRDAIKRVVSELGVGVGNSLQALKDGKLKGGLGDTFLHGVAVGGPADKELERLLRSAGMEYSVQNGELQVLPQGGALNGTALELTPDSGLVGSPEMGRDSKGVAQLKSRALLTAEIYPGRQVHVVSDAVDVYLRVESASYVGQFAGNDWYVDFEGAPLAR